MNKTTAPLIVLSLLLCSQGMRAEEIKIPIGSQSPELNNISRPTMGMSKARVKGLYGAPQKENAAKGKPPISSWEYADFIVYFEYDHVIDSVIKPIYHESTVTVVKEAVTQDESTAPMKRPIKKPVEMPVEDLDLHAK